jgi:hypothetical protein
MLERTILLAIVTCYALPATADPEPTAPTAAEVRALLQASGTGDVVNQIGPVAAQQLNLALHRANPNLPARADAIVEAVVVAYLQERAEQDHVVDRLVSIYAKYLTKTDVRHLTEFYRSPVGRKLVSVTPGISLESAKVGTQWMESILQGLQAQLLSRLKTEKLIE